MKVLESENQSSEYLESDLNGKIKGSGSEENEREEELVNAPVRILIQILYLRTFHHHCNAAPLSIVVLKPPVKDLRCFAVFWSQCLAGGT